MSIRKLNIGGGYNCADGWSQPGSMRLCVEWKERQDWTTEYEEWVEEKKPMEEKE